MSRKHSTTQHAEATFPNGPTIGADVVASRAAGDRHYTVKATTWWFVQGCWEDPIVIPSVGMIDRDTSQKTSREWVYVAAEIGVFPDVTTHHPTLADAAYAAAQHACQVRRRQDEAEQVAYERGAADAAEQAVEFEQAAERALNDAGLR